MKPWTTASLVVAAAVISAVSGFWLGFRAAWNMSPMTAAAPRGVVAMAQIRGIDSGHTNDVKVFLESDIDSGLMWWHEVSRSPIRGMLNTLSGDDVYPSNEEYVRRLAAYRKAHPSPLWDPEVEAEFQAGMERADRFLAAQLAEAGVEQRRAIDEVIAKYAP